MLYEWKKNNCILCSWLWGLYTFIINHLILTLIYLIHFVFRFELALQQNEIMDVFYIDWLDLGDDDGSYGNKADNHLKVGNRCFEYTV